MLRAGAALVGTAWAIEGGLNAASHMMGWGAMRRAAARTATPRGPAAQRMSRRLNQMQESGAPWTTSRCRSCGGSSSARRSSGLTLRSPTSRRRRGRSNANCGPPGAGGQGRRSPRPLASTTLPSRSLPTATAPASAASPARTAGLWELSRRSTS